MNILFFLIPKSEVAYIFEDETLRQTLEKMEHRKYSCIPILTMDGKYLGTISEGDLLWGMRRADIHDIKETEGIPIMAIPRRATYKPVHANSNMEDLLDRAINQNFVPVVDDQGSFIGIITRKSIIKYCYNEIKTAQKTAGEEIHWAAKRKRMALRSCTGRSRKPSFFDPAVVFRIFILFFCGSYSVHLHLPQP